RHGPAEQGLRAGRRRHRQARVGRSPQRLRRGTRVRVGRQLSLFGVEAGPPVPEDLEGLLAGPGQVVRMGGTARVSVVVDELWRAQVLHAELRTRGLAVSCVSTVEQHIGVRTAYSSTLAALGTAWLRGAVKVPPPGCGLDGRR